MQYIFITDSDYANTDTSFQYLLGFQPSLGAMILSEDILSVFLDGRYFEKTKHIEGQHIQNILGNTKLKIEYKQFTQLIPALRGALKSNEDITFQENIALSYYNKLKDIFSPSQIYFERGYFLEMRSKKTQEEKQKIQKAIKVIDAVMHDMGDMISAGEIIGMTERELRVIILQKIHKYGGESESFDAIVAFAKNSAVPHHVAGDTLIGNGVLLLDMGAKYQGYCSDCTRTFWVGEKTQQYHTFQEVYEVVKTAHLRACEGYLPGMKANELDTLSRDVVQNSPFKDLFIHSLGHSLGLDIHEDPRIRNTDTTLLEEGMVFTIEPGIYISGEFGIRLEDIVFLENGSLKKYTTLAL